MDGQIPAVVTQDAVGGARPAMALPVDTATFLTLQQEWLRAWMAFWPVHPLMAPWVQTAVEPDDRLEPLFDLGHRTTAALAYAGRLAAQSTDHMVTGSKRMLGLALEPGIRAMRSQREAG